jgi:hypothetical protein
MRMIFIRERPPNENDSHSVNRALKYTHNQGSAATLRTCPIYPAA